jgi:hypothetical protein
MSSLGPQWTGWFWPTLGRTISLTHLLIQTLLSAGNASGTPRKCGDVQFNFMCPSPVDT